MSETIQGIQSRGVIACAKHWILNEQETYREKVSVSVDDRTMHELYMWPFADAVRAGVGSVMCSYNKIESIYACENNWTTNYLLKNELNFQGFGECLPLSPRHELTTQSCPTGARSTPSWAPP